MARKLEEAFEIRFAKMPPPPPQPQQPSHPQPQPQQQPQSGVNSQQLTVNTSLVTSLKQQYYSELHGGQYLQNSTNTPLSSSSSSSRSATLTTTANNANQSSLGNFNCFINHLEGRNGKCF